MADLHLFELFVIIAIVTSLSFDSCSCANLKLHNVSKFGSQFEDGWWPATATWYGAPNGDGSEGGACGYGSAVGQPPFSAMVSAGGPSLFKNGQGCGACYQVKCMGNFACSGKPVTVVITDSCPGGPCAAQVVHFDLSGTAFGAMASLGWADQLHNIGVLKILHRRVECEYPGVPIAFHVDPGSNPYYFASVIEFANGEGRLGAVHLKQAEAWLPMQRLWGALWMINSGFPLRAPFSIKLTALVSGKSVVADRVIPVGWLPGQTYRSFVNF